MMDEPEVLEAREALDGGELSLWAGGVLLAIEGTTALTVGLLLSEEGSSATISRLLILSTVCSTGDKGGVESCEKRGEEATKGELQVTVSSSEKVLALVAAEVLFDFRR